MSPKFEKLLQRIQNVQNFVATRVNQNPTFGTVAQELNKLADTLKVGKLRIQIVSESPVLAESLQNLVSTRKNLAAIYQFKTVPLPSQSQRTEIASPAAVILKYTNSAGEQSTRFPLSKNQKVVIGRSADCQIRIADECKFVSGHHAEIVPLVNSGFGKTDWQLCDTSSNGSYIKGQKLLKGCQSLQTGDVIILGYPEATRSSPEMVVDFQFNPAAENVNNQIEKQLIDCDILYLVISSGQTLSADEKQFIEQAIKAQVLKVVIAVDSTATSQESQANLAAVDTWIKSQNFSQSLVLVSAPISSFYPNSQANRVELSAQLESNLLSQVLENIANGEFEEVLKERVKKQFLAQINILDSLFKKQEDNLKQESQKLEQLLRELSDQEINKVFQQVNADKEQTFQQIKSKILESKDAFIHPYTTKSLLHRIKIFTEELKPVVTKKGSEVYLSLTSEQMGERESLNNYMRNHLCYKEIINWVNEEWKRICYNYADGGLNGLFHRTETKLFKLTQTQNLPNSSFYSDKPNFDVYKYLQDSVVEFPSEIPYQEGGSPIGGWVGMAVSTVMAYLGVQAGNPLALIQAFNTIINIRIGGDARQQQAAARLKQQTENLKKGLCNHYQGLAKFLVEKMGQNCFFLSLFDTEARRLREMTESIKNERINPYINEIKKRLEQCNNQQNGLKKQQMELMQRIKGE
ncbi:FHA domain-containing protein [Microcoleus sp.]|uniref:FHA domain-containing protein n=1 Tax=Microcoleus sp. TaxID=44472 RepID=UPI003525470C